MKIHPLFLDLVNSLVERTNLNMSDVAHHFYAAGKPVVEEEKPVAYMIPWTEGYEAAKKDTENKDARIKDLEAKLEEKKQVSLDSCVRTSLEAWARSLSLDYEKGRNEIRNAALEEAAKEVGKMQDDPEYLALGEIAARIRGLKR